MLEKIVREMTSKFIMVDKELKDIKEQIKHQLTVNSKGIVSHKMRIIQNKKQQT